MDYKLKKILNEHYEFTEGKKPISGGYKYYVNEIRWVGNIEKELENYFRKKFNIEKQEIKHKCSGCRIYENWIKKDF